MIEETPTREMDCPRTEVDGGRVEYRDNAYRIEYIRNEVRDMWELLDSDADDGAPVTLQDKQTRPYERNYPTKEEVQDWSRNLFKK